jgi:hypothetical protein
MSKMNPEVKAKWVAALRSGEYVQSDARVLNDGAGSFCCLGVLCDLYSKEAGIEWEWTQHSEGMRLPIGGCYYPPSDVRTWAAFHEDEQTVEIGGKRESVAVHNDGICIPRRTFVEIADAIEKQL